MGKASEIGFNITATTKGVKSTVTQVKSLGQAVEASSKKSVSAMRSAERASKRMAHNTGKNYAASALGLNPLTKAYVTLAASVYALESAFRAVSMVAKFQETTNSFQVMAKTFDFNAEKMILRLKDLSGGAITASETMRAASLGMASGLAIEQLEGLTTVARKAARAMGIGMEDAFSRIIRGVTKLEPELLDEIGLVTRLQTILPAYAKSIGKTVDQISSYQKTQIFANEVLKEGAKKFGAINVAIQSTSERLEEMKATLTDNIAIFGGTFLPLLLGTANAIASLGSQILIGASIWATYKIGMKLLHKEEIIGIGIKKVVSGALAHEQAAYIALTEALVAEAAAKTKESAVTRNATQIALTHAKAKWEEAKATTASAVAAERGVASTAKGGLGKLAGSFGRALTSPITMAVGALLLLADAFGLVDKAMAAISGSAKNTATQFKKLSATQQAAHIILTEYGVSAQLALDDVNAFGGVVEYSKDQVVIQNAVIEIASNEFLVLSKIVATTAKGTKIYAGIVADMNPELNKANAELIKLESNLKKVKKEQEEGITIWQSLGETLFGFTHNSEAALKRVEKATKAVNTARKETETIIENSSEVIQAKAAKDAVTKYEEAQDALNGKLKFTTIQLDKMGKTKQDRLTAQLASVTDSLKPLKAAVESTAASIKVLKGLDDDKNIKQIKLQTDTMEKQQQLIVSSTEAQKRLTAEIANKNRIKAMRGELALLRQLAAENKNRIEIAFGTSDGLPAATKTYYDKLASLAKANQENELALLKTQLMSTKEFETKKLIIQSKGRQASDTITAARTEALKESYKEQVRMHGSMWENILADMKDGTDKADGIGRQLANTFTDVFKIIGKTIQTEIGKAFGFVEDKAKTTFQNALESAKKSYAGMVAAANDAFGLGQRDSGISQGRGLQDIERKRVRDIADLTAKRNAGGVDQASFDQGLSDIGTGVRRSKEDLALAGSRSEEDLQTERGDSLLEAQLALNEAMLEAEQAFSDAKAAIWTDMYASIKSTVFTTLSEIAAQKAAMWAWEMLSESTLITGLLGMKAAGATAAVAVTEGQAVAETSALAAPIVAQHAAAVPFVGAAIGAAVVAGVMALLVTSGKSFSSPTITAPTVPSVPTLKAHTGGIVAGLGQEVPITAYKGEGILNTYNGMKAVGGESGLNQANATGVLPNTAGNTMVNITIQTADGKELGSLTIDNFEQFIRGKGAQTMRKVTKSGVILIDKRGVA